MKISPACRFSEGCRKWPQTLKHRWLCSRMRSPQASHLEKERGRVKISPSSRFFEVSRRRSNIRFCLENLDFMVAQKPQSRRFKGRPTISSFFRRLQIFIFVTALQRFGRFCRCLSSGMRSPQESTGVTLGKRQAKSADFPGIQVFAKKAGTLAPRKT